MKSIVEQIIFEEILRLAEDKKSFLLNKYPDQKELIDFLSQNDPSGLNKYLEYMLVQIVKRGRSKEDVVHMVNFFHDNVKKLKNKDISAYKTIEDIEGALGEGGEKRTEIVSKRKQEIQEFKQDTYEVLNNGKYFIVRPRTEESSRYFGKGTRWCTAASSQNMFDSYNKRGSALYIIRKEDLPTDDPDYKVQASVKKDGGVHEIRNAPDNDVSQRLDEIYNGEWEHLEELIGRHVEKYPPVDVTEAWEKQCEEIQQTFASRAKHCIASYSIDDDNEPPYVSYWGSFMVTIPNAEEVIRKINPKDIEDRYAYSAERALVRAIDLSIEEAVIEGDEIRFDVRGDDYASDPDGFGEFCEHLIDDIDKKYAKIKDKVCQFLFGNNYVSPDKIFNSLEQEEGEIGSILSVDENRHRKGDSLDFSIGKSYDIWNPDRETTPLLIKYAQEKVNEYIGQKIYQFAELADKQLELPLHERLTIEKVKQLGSEILPVVDYNFYGGRKITVEASFSGGSTEMAQDTKEIIKIYIKYAGNMLAIAENAMNEKTKALRIERGIPVQESKKGERKFMKHNKKRNTAFLYEAITLWLTRQIVTSDVNQDITTALLKEHFHKGTPLFEELKLYQEVMNSKGSNISLVGRILEEVKKEYLHLDKRVIFNAQTRLLEAINKTYGDEVFSLYLANYRDLASVYQILNEKLTIKERATISQRLCESLSNVRDSRNENEEYVIEESKIDNLTCKVFLESFNKEYAKGQIFTEEQQNVLLGIVLSSSDNGVYLKTFLNEEINRLRKVVSESKEIKEDQEMQEKANKVLTFLDEFKKRPYDNEMLQKLMEVQELASEIATEK